MTRIRHPFIAPPPRGRLSRLMGAAAFCLVGSALSAQSITTGAISGKIQDASGAPVAHARILITSSQITRSTTTDGAGRFMLGLLNPGTWKVVVRKNGLQTASEILHVRANGMTPFNLKMKPIASATVVVEEAASAIAIDPTSTASSMAMSTDTISKLPVTRNITDLIYLAPGTHFGGTMTEGTGLDYSIAGGSGAENQFVVDGLVTNDPRYGGQGTELIPEFIDSVEVINGGFKPEYSAMGGVFNSIIKSGTNQFHGSAWANWSPAGVEAKPKSGPAHVDPAPQNRYDLGFNAGGAFIPDKLFYFVGMDEWSSPKLETN